MRGQGGPRSQHDHGAGVDDRVRADNHDDDHNEVESDDDDDDDYGDDNDDDDVIYNADGDDC